VKRIADRPVTVGVDTHKYVHVAVALSEHGQRLGDITVAADAGGYAQLLAWARSFGAPWCFGVEGCGSYGQGFVGYLRRHDQRVVEAGRPDRRDRRERGKSDPIDAENAARAVLAGTATGIPKTADGTSEMIREIKVARDTAVKGRTQAIITLKALVVTAPDELRQELQPLSKARLRDRCAGLRPSEIDTPLAAAKHALRALARRWQTSSKRSRTTTGCSTPSPPKQRRACAKRSGSASTLQPRCSSSLVTTPSASAQRPRSPSSAARAQSQRLLASRNDTA
jgi:transposase